MEPNLAVLAIAAVLLVALVLGAVAGGWKMRDRAAVAELALELRHVAELELEVATLEAQAVAGGAAAADVLLVERKLAEVRARVRGDRAARRLGLLRAGARDGGAAAPAGGGAAGPDGPARGEASPVA